MILFQHFHHEFQNDGFMGIWMWNGVVAYRGWDEYANLTYSFLYDYTTTIFYGLNIKDWTASSLTHIYGGWWNGEMVCCMAFSSYHYMGAAQWILNIYGYRTYGSAPIKTLSTFMSPTRHDNSPQSEVSSNCYVTDEMK